MLPLPRWQQLRPEATKHMTCANMAQSTWYYFSVCGHVGLCLTFTVISSERNMEPAHPYFDYSLKLEHYRRTLISFSSWYWYLLWILFFIVWCGLFRCWNHLFPLIYKSKDFCRDIGQKHKQFNLRRFVNFWCIFLRTSTSSSVNRVDLQSDMCTLLRLSALLHSFLQIFISNFKNVLV